MKKLLLCSMIVLLVFSGISISNAQYMDSNFTVAASIKPSDFASIPGLWPDSTAAWRVYANYDIDKDGKKEFLVIVDPATTGGDTSMPRILLFEASGNDKYDLVWHTQIPVQYTSLGSWPCLTVGDVDKDGNNEVIFGLPSDARFSSNSNPDRVFFYEYDPSTQKLPDTPTLSSTLGFPEAYYFAITSIIADDVDEDGDVELIISARRAYGGGSGTSSLRPLLIYHLLGDISPGFSTLELEFADTLGTFNGGYYFNNHVVDFDGDGKKEIWGFTWDMIAFAVYEADGKDTYVLRADVNQATADVDYGEQNSVGFFDANHDGKLEMYIAGQTSPPSAVLYVANTTDLTSLSTSSVKFITPALDNHNFQGADIGDIDGDGEVDFFIGDWSSAARAVYHLEHINGMPYDDPTGYLFDTLYRADNDSSYAFSNVTFGNDLDGDGKREVILVNTETRAGHPEDASIIILESKVVVLNVQRISDVTPQQFSLEQNYPNPFNPSSTIRFSLQQSLDVELTIANSLGQTVATLINKKLESGTHEVSFNADGLSSGTYFYTLKAGTFSETKKMILMK